MKRLFLFLFCFAFFSATNCRAVSGQARITRIQKEVKLLRAQKPPQVAKLNDVIGSETSIQTGPGSQMEFRFGDEALVRLGQNSLVSVKEGTRRMDLVRGAILIRVAKSESLEIATGDAVSAVGGTTSLLENYPGAYIKLISLEGTARIFMPSIVGESVLVKPGQLVMFHTKPKPTGLPNPVDVDINRLIATSLLIKGYSPLGTENSIAAGANDQKKAKAQGALADTNLVIFGRGTLVSIVPPTPQEQRQMLAKKPTPTPTPTPARPGH